MRRKTENIHIKLTPAQKEAIYVWPLCRQFRIVHIDASSGCIVYQHVLVDKDAKDYGHVLAVARAYARECDCATAGSTRLFQPGKKTEDRKYIPQYKVIPIQI